MSKKISCSSSTEVSPNLTTFITRLPSSPLYQESPSPITFPSLSEELVFPSFSSHYPELFSPNITTRSINDSITPFPESNRIERRNSCILKRTTTDKQTQPQIYTTPNPLYRADNVYTHPHKPSPPYGSKKTPTISLFQRKTSSSDSLKRKSNKHKKTLAQFPKNNLIEENYLSLEQILTTLATNNVDAENKLTLFFRTLPLFTTIDQMLVAVRSVYKEAFPLIQRGLLDLMRHWVESDTDSCRDFLMSDNEVLIVNGLLSSELEETDKVMCKKLKLTIEKMRKKIKKQILVDEEKVSSLPFIPMSSLKWTEYNVKWLAATLTLHEHSLFASIPTSAFFKQMRGERSTISSTICKTITFFNSLSNWVTITLVKEARLQKRIEYLTEMIYLSDNLFFLNNFSSLMAIIAGLNHFSIVRMKMTWKGLDPELLKKYQKLESLMSHTQNYSNYRSLLKKCREPCVPYLGLILADLTFIDTGNLDIVDGKINFAKWILVGNQLENISTYQKLSYKQLTDTPNLLLFIPAISEFQNIDDDECDWYSKIMESADYELTIAQLVEELVQTRKENELLKKQ